ncbi:hypothetical protein [uncultured Actinobaculum sp.]|uniref:hypothetical protein n=1 Tax=uncultured Actinobaculum sp. TaxID=655643 RepID=UPI0028045A92|nr:hypothetical protein [uncultured Actinobaculum sp.]
MSNSILNLPGNIFTSFQEISGLFLGNAGCGTIESMSFPKRLLGPGEKVILDIHPSATILLPNIFAAVLFFYNRPGHVDFPSRLLAAALPMDR